MKKLKLDQIRIDGGTQQRSIDREVVAIYAECLDKLPPIEVVFDGKEYWLWDGFHRMAAAVEKKAKVLPANIREGDKRLALWLALSANATHGMRRTDAEVRRIVRIALTDEEWGKKSLRAIADHIGTSHVNVRNIKKGDGGSVNSLQTEDGDNPPDKTKSREPEPLKDQVGVKVPKELTEIFLRRGNIRAMINRIDEVKRDIDAMVGKKDKLIVWLNLQGFKADIGNVRRNLKAAMPYAVCPYCGGANKKCKACKGNGFVGKLVFDNAPAGMKKK